MGCTINAWLRNGEVVKIEGAKCGRGKDYSIQEVKSPVRDFFTTVRVKGGKIPMLSVRSTRPIPKNMLIPCALELAKVVVSAPIKLGEPVVKNILNLGIDIIATKNIEESRKSF